MKRINDYFQTKNKKINNDDGINQEEKKIIKLQDSDVDSELEKCNTDNLEFDEFGKYNN